MNSKIVTLVTEFALEFSCSVHNMKYGRGVLTVAVLWHESSGNEF